MHDDNRPFQRVSGPLEGIRTHFIRRSRVGMAARLVVRWAAEARRRRDSFAGLDARSASG